MTTKERLHQWIDAMEEDRAARLLDELRTDPAPAAEAADRPELGPTLSRLLRNADTEVIPAASEKPRGYHGRMSGKVVHSKGRFQAHHHWDKVLSAAYLRMIGHTQEECAKSIGRSRGTIHNWESDALLWCAARSEARAAGGEAVRVGARLVGRRPKWRAFPFAA